MTTKKRLAEAEAQGLVVGTLDLNLQHLSDDQREPGTVLGLGVVRVKDSLLTGRTALNVWHAWTRGAEGKLNPLERMLVDLLDGTKGPHELHEQTGLPMERCEEIYNWYAAVPQEMINR
jgi:hypothetical protein